MARWVSREPAWLEPPGWYRCFVLANWDTPDVHELAMIDGCTAYRCWPGSPDSRWRNWPQFLHEQHARRRWAQAQGDYRQARPAFAEQEFEAVMSRHAVRRDAW
jgi:hypothetical protein